jgi:superfamily II DNA or RNA helicase|tara:strand:+ start:1277 stop:4132 length:2856 start_codon:yes stop_codon:yes gene_type:complete
MSSLGVNECSEYLTQHYESANLTLQWIRKYEYAYVLNDASQKVGLVALCVQDRPVSCEALFWVIKTLDKIAYKAEISHVFEVFSSGGFDKNTDLFDVLYVARTQINKEYPHFPTQTALLPHNAFAFQKIAPLLYQGNSVCAVRATGTGKSHLIEASIAKESGNIVIVAPTRYILEALKEKFGKKKKIFFFTYKWLAEHRYEEWKAINPSMVILDEYHRAGAKTWYEGVIKLIRSQSNPIVLGTTATDVRYLNGELNMSEVLFNGNVVARFDLSTSIAYGVTPSPKYIRALYETERVKAEWSKKYSHIDNGLTSAIRTEIECWADKNKPMEILKKYVKKEGGKFIVFFDNIESLKRQKLQVIDWFKELTRESQEKSLVQSIEIHSQNTVRENNRALNRFKISSGGNSPTATLLLTVNMLNEGIHVPNIDGIIMLRKTSSPNIFFQQLGRCLSCFNGKSSQPLVFDFMNNIEKIVNQKELCHNSEYLECSNKARTGLGLRTLNPQMEVEDESISLVKHLEKFVKKYNSCSISEDIERIMRFYGAFGNVNVPNEYIDKDGCLVKTAVKRLRAAKRLGHLKDEKVKLLEEINFSWDKNEHFLRLGVRALKEFRKHHKHNKYGQFRSSEGILLSEWAKNFRRRALHQIPISIVTELEELDFDFEGNEKKDDYIEGLKIAALFYKDYKHLNIPESVKTPSGRKVKNVLTHAVRKAKDGTLDKDLLSNLSILEIPISTREIRFWEAFEALKRALVSNHDFCHQTSTILSDGRTLASAIERWQNDFKSGILPEYKVKALESINFSLVKPKVEKSKNTTVYIEEGVPAAINYMKIVGHSNFSGGVIEGFDLENWAKITRQRIADAKKNKKEPFDPELLLLLKKNGFREHKNEGEVQQLLLLVKNHIQKYSALPVKRYINADGIKLGQRWYDLKQRIKNNHTKLSGDLVEQIKKIEQLQVF